MTTSIPEAPDSGRNWDYRYCWLRDAYFVVHALNRLGATRDHGRVSSATSPTSSPSADNGHLQPVYSITLGTRLVEQIQTALTGYRGMGPVRVGNQAYEHLQNDVYGSVILTAAQMFFDQRLTQPGNVRIFERLESIGEQAVPGLRSARRRALGVPLDREGPHVLGRNVLGGLRPAGALSPPDSAWMRVSGIGAAMPTGCTRRSPETPGTPNGTPSWRASAACDVDASLLLLGDLGFVDGSDPRFVGTVEAIESTLREGDYLFRYRAEDDFGMPETSFTICTFWYIDALAAIGRYDEARRLFENILSCRNHVGLLSEDLDTKTRELWGNFPQTYSMVGMISSAMRLSKPWEEAF